MTISFEEASKLLSQCTRNELRDHAFGDREVYFTLNDEEVAEGYLGGGMASVSIKGKGTEFTDGEARQLLALGTLGQVERNDSMDDDD